MSSPYISSFSISYAQMNPINCPDLTNSVNVIFGRNEAGKSRIQEFLKWMMFASSEEIESLKTAATKKAFAHIEGSTTGTATFHVGDLTAKLTQRIVDGITQTHIDNNRISPRELSRIFTDGLTRAYYNNIFSLTLDELAQVESDRFITETEMMNLFFGATSTGAGISPTTLLQVLANKKEDLFSQSKNATTKSINKTLKALKENTARIKELRQEESNLEGVDVEILKLKQSAKQIENSLEELRSHRELLIRIVENAEDFGNYERLANIETPEINDDLIARNIDINMLIQMCEQGGEEELERISLSIEKLKVEHERQKSELAITLNPDRIETPILTPQFTSLLNSEERAQSEYSIETKNIAQSIDQLNNDLALYMQDADRLRIAIDTERKTESFDEPKAKSTSNKVSRSTLVFAGALVIAGIIGFIFRQPLAGVIGIVAGIAATVFAFKQHRDKTPQEVAPIAIDHNIQQAKRDLESLTAKIENYQSRVEELLLKQTEIKLQREKESQKYVQQISQIGFASDSQPHLISLYLDAYKIYSARRERIAEYESNLEAAKLRISEPFERAEKLRNIAKGTTCETNENFVRLSDIHAWASALFDLSEEHKIRDKQLHERENEIRHLEKVLTTKFGSVEDAREVYNRVSINEVTNDLDKSKEKLEYLNIELKEIDEEIIRKTLDRERAGTSTAIAEAVQLEQSLIDELKSLHQLYAGYYVAHDVVERALEKYLEDNQPELLRVASRMFSHVTRNQWNSISISRNEASKKNEPLIRVSGTRAPHGIAITQLSRGSREQLYLCLRLALMQTSTRGASIPVLFDDIAVNSDRSRIETLADIIGEIGQQRQVIYFTCHEATRDILADRAQAQVIEI